MASVFTCLNVMAAEWRPIGTGEEKIAIDQSRISYGGEGLVAVWSRLELPRTMSDAEGRYNAIEALNRYDCADNRFATLKRLYLFDDVLVRVEHVMAPKELGIAAGSADAAILARFCDASRRKPQRFETVDTVSGGLKFADVRKMADDMTSHMLRVADSAAGPGTAISPPAPASATPPPALRRFIAYPRIDPSQLQHPTDEPPPPESAKSAQTATVKSEASESDSLLKGLKRHARELELATSGPKRKAASRRKKLTGDPVADTPRKEIPWGYEGEGAPSRWARLRADFGFCESGKRQSPIDIRDAIQVDLEPIKFDYRSSPFRIVDTGHTVRILVGAGNTVTVMGRTYRLEHLDFHQPAEEQVDGHGFEMEMQLVHKDDEGHVAIVAVLLERGPEHPVIQTFWNNLPLETNVELAPAIAVDPNKLLPELRDYYTYMGSLTTPPCSEGVLWMVLKQPLQLSPEQIAIFAHLYRNNSRPIQSANNRLIKASR